MEREKYNKIVEGIAEGKTLQIVTAWKCTEIDRRTVANFKKNGYEVMKNGREDEQGFYVRRGKNWDYCSPLGCLIRLV